MDLKEAIKSLDPKVDENWTEAGLPSLEVIKKLTGKSFSRKEVTDAEPLLTREKLLAGVDTKVDTSLDADKDDAPEVQLTQPEPEPEAPVEDRRAALKAKLEEATKVLTEAQAVQVEAANEVTRAQAVVDKYTVELDDIQDKHSNTHEIMHYLKRQQEIREARAQNPDPRSDLDRSLQGRRRAVRSPL